MSFIGFEENCLARSHLPKHDTKMNFIEPLPGYELFDATSELLKLILRKKRKKDGRRVLCFHSWRAAITDMDGALDAEELAYFKWSNCADIHLVSSEPQRAWVNAQLGKPSIVLPYTVFQNSAIYTNYGSHRQFDVAFSCMFTPEHYERKRASLVLGLARQHRDLRIVWYGDYCPYERWWMESAFNSHFELGMPAPADWGGLWTERESSLCWYDGGGIFREEVAKSEFMQRLLIQAREERLNIQFYRNLTRQQVVNLLNRSRAVVALGRLDQWPRCVNEALACGTPVVCVQDLRYGTEPITPETGALVAPTVSAIRAGLSKAWALVPDIVRATYYAKYGAINATRRLVKALDDIGIHDWMEVVGIQRPAETRLKQAIRAIG
jgi:glycosyltransferase involved in cell wall biosynthesis